MPKRARLVVHQAARQVPAHEPVESFQIRPTPDHFKRLRGLHVTGVARGEQLLLQISSYPIMTKTSTPLCVALLLLAATGCSRRVALVAVGV